MTKWKDCIKEPAEEGKKVLCMQNGDFYVAQRFKDRYIPIPFSTHVYCIHMQYPEKYCEIDFPAPYTGYMRFQTDHDTDMKIQCEMTLSQIKEYDKEAYDIISDAMIKLIGDKKTDEYIRKTYKKHF